MYIIYKENMRKYDKARSIYEWMKRGGLGFSLGAFMILSILTSCAKMGQPDGGWYDELPPRVVATSPAEGATDVSSRRILIGFDEFIVLQNATENVVVSPPQLEAPVIKAQGKRISVQLQDSLIPNTTYTIDFSDAISDNNEGNPMGNYTYTFSTGQEIDTLEIAGYVLNAKDLEPVKGILVGLYANLHDTAFATLPMQRVARTDSRGHFCIKGVKAGDYRVYALRDQNNDYRFSQKSEEMAFTPEIFTPSWKPDTRQDTIWRDSLHIDHITTTGYTHFLPDDVVLRAFTEEQTGRYFIKADRSDEHYFTLFYTYGDKELPVVKGLNFDADRDLRVEPSLNQDTITYWICDTALVNSDTLRMTVLHNVCDTAGVLHPQTDTLQVLAKVPYARRMKLQAKNQKKWEKEQRKRKERGEPYQTIMPDLTLEPDYDVPSQLDPDKNLAFIMPVPIAEIDTAKIHLYQKIDTLWYKAKYLLGEKPGTPRRYELVGEWEPGAEYSLEIDSAAFTDIYGRVAKAEQFGFNVYKLEDYATLTFSLTGMAGKPCLVQLLNKQGYVVRQIATTDATAHFFYVHPGTYYLRLIEDDNDNGRWDTGEFATRRQPEAVYYYPKAIECRAKWDVTETWSPHALPLFQQKPNELVRQKADKQRQQLKHRNAERAAKLGIEIPASVLGQSRK